MTEEKIRQIEAYSLEEAMKRLETVVAEMSADGLSLEKALSLYEEGVALVRICNTELETAERKINMLKMSADGEVSEAPFDALGM